MRRSLGGLQAEGRINIRTVKSHHKTERLGGAIKNLRDRGWQIRSEVSADQALATTGVRDYVLVSSLPGRPSTLRQDKIRRLEGMLARGTSGQELLKTAHASERDFYGAAHFERWSVASAAGRQHHAQAVVAEVPSLIATNGWPKPCPRKPRPGDAARTTQSTRSREIKIPFRAIVGSVGTCAHFI